ncbi:hypothetical protein MLD38_032407 [Melastoma candidum]|uniref:Uncharacterized protein n=1 Tax=Melastoma candidum TaxID=119954 RepID=A0ACB9M5J8_9MYRT|nr:hypothetical protein MLD38_032407 [Melastoma candidum]
MEDPSVAFATAILVAAIIFISWIGKHANRYLFERNLGEMKGYLPPGDCGLPVIGNMWSFLFAFKSGNPDSFTFRFVSRFGRTGMYKALMYGSPSVIVTAPEPCRRILLDDVRFCPGWPTSTQMLLGKHSFVGIIDEEHRFLRRLTAAPVTGHEALSLYIPYMEQKVKSDLEKWSKMGEIEFLTEIRKLTFKIIMYIFLSSESERVVDVLEKEYTHLTHGLRAMAINIPGFAYQRALTVNLIKSLAPTKSLFSFHVFFIFEACTNSLYHVRKPLGHSPLQARVYLVTTLRSVLDEKRKKRDEGKNYGKKDMMDGLMEVEDESGRKLRDEEIIDILIMYLTAGHESSAHIAMWSVLLLQQHPEFLEKARVSKW